jgi:signal transduction histidine kinase
VTFRARLLLAFATATLVALSLLALGVRRQVTARVVAQHERRVHTLASVALHDFERQSAEVSARLQSLARSLPDDNRFRLAVQGSNDERGFLLDWAGQAMRVTGLSVLQLQDESGRILSSGHFRNEYDRLEPRLPALLATVADRPAVAKMRAPGGPMLALVRVDSVRIGTRMLTLVGGFAIDRAMLERFARDSQVTMSLLTPGDTLSSDSTRASGARLVSATGQLAYLGGVGSDTMRVMPASLLVTHGGAELDALRRDIDGWFVVALAVASVAGIALALWLSAHLGKPLAELARATSSISLEGPELELATQRDDEIGTLARRFGVMTRRLRANAAQLLASERRATMGEMARQVNHDVKNGLIPIRNVVQHLAQVQERSPDELAGVFAERRETLESSIAYLDTLARNYARLTPSIDRRIFDAAAVARDAARSASLDGVVIQARIDGQAPAFGDPVILRRILDNLLRNAVESLPPSGGTVSIDCGRTPAGAVRMTVADTGRGMSKEELARAFDDFHTTKSGGTGLGLSVVRRLTADLHADLRVESAPGRGTTFVIDLPSPAPVPVPA